MRSNIYISLSKISLILWSIFFSFHSVNALSWGTKILDETWYLSSQVSLEGEIPNKTTKTTSEEKWASKTGSLDVELIRTAEEEQEEQKLKQDINTYIIESYKAQGTKIIKDLSIKLSKSLPDKNDRQEAYQKIRMSLETRLEKTGKLKMSETKKLILKEFLSHMIELLDKKIEELS